MSKQLVKPKGSHMKASGRADPEYQFERARDPMGCVVDGCDKKVYGIYNMCRKHWEQFIDGRLLPKSASSRPALPPKTPSSSFVKESPIMVSIPNSQPAAAAEVPEVLCEEQGCQEPVMTSGFGHKMKVCKQHHQARMAVKRAEKNAERERLAARMQAAPPRAPVSTPAVAASPIVTAPALVEQAATLGKELLPGLFEQLLREAFAKGGDDVLNITVTGLKVQFSGELDIRLEPDAE